MFRDLVDEDGNELDSVPLEWDEIAIGKDGKIYKVHFKMSMNKIEMITDEDF
jgi:hypothetical protein